MRMRAIVLVGVGLAIGGCQTAPTTKDAPNLVNLDVTFSWAGIDRCSSVSPEFEVKNAPAATKTVKFRMTDLDSIGWNHGGGQVDYTGPKVLKGTLKSYNGPCPPSGSHSCEFSVEALNDKGDTVLGRGKAMRKFP